MITEDKARERGLELLERGDEHFKILFALNPHWSEEERQGRILDWVEKETAKWSRGHTDV